MYCRKCGKWMEGDNELCADCQETEEFFSDKTQPEETVGEPVVKTGSRKEGFGKALTATILGVMASFFAGFSLGFIMAAEEVAIDPMYVAETVTEALKEAGLYGATVFFAIVALGLSIPSLIMGISSIKCFKRACREGKVKPIATLILGIVAVVSAAEGILFGLLDFLCL